MSLFNVHRHPNIWIDPNSFRPERFDPSSELYKTRDGKNRPAVSHCPFTLGPRNCPGQSLALVNLKLLVAYLVKRADFDVSLDEKAAEYDRRHGLVSFAQSSANHLFIHFQRIKY